MALPNHENAKFLIVSATVTNNGNQPLENVLLKDFANITGAGRTYTPLDDHNSVYANQDLNFGTLGPGLSTPFTWVFEVPGDFVAEDFGYDDVGDRYRGNNVVFIDVRGYDK